MFNVQNLTSVARAGCELARRATEDVAKKRKYVVFLICLYYFCKAVRYNREQKFNNITIIKNEKANFYVGNNVASVVRCVQ